MPPVSVVVPILNEAPALPALFAALESWRPYIQLIVVDGGSTDASLEMAKGAADLTLSCSPGRALQQNVGASSAQGDYIVFLHCDTRIQGTAEHFIDALQVMTQWGFCKVALSGARPTLRVIEYFMNWRAKLTRVATGDQVLCFRRSFFEDLDGFASIPLMEDVEICKRARRRASPKVLPAMAVTSSRRWEQRGILRTVFAMWALRLAYWRGVNPEQLHRRYYQ